MQRWNEIDEADFLNEMKESQGRFIMRFFVVWLIVMLALVLYFELAF